MQESAHLAPPNMAYCTTQDVIDEYGTKRIAQVTGDATGQTVNTTKADKAVSSYGDFIEQHVRMQHPDNPFDTAHTFLNGLNVEGAFLRLKKASPAGLDDKGIAAERRLDRILERIADGKLSLLDADDQAAPEEHDITLSEAISSKERLFGGHRKDLVVE